MAFMLAIEASTSVFTLFPPDGILRLGSSSTAIRCVISVIFLIGLVI